MSEVLDRAAVHRELMSMRARINALVELVCLPEKTFMPKQKAVDVGNLQTIVAAHFQIHPSAMRVALRTADIAWPRQIAMALAHDILKMSLSDVGRAFGGRDHGTVIHAIKVVRDRSGTSEEAKAQVEAVSLLVLKAFGAQ